MQKYSLNELIEFNDDKARPKILISEPGRRMVLFSLRAGQSIPEHTNPEQVLVHALQGHVTFYEGVLPCELRAGEVICIENGVPHRVDALDDSVLLVLAIGITTATKSAPKELDLREVPRPERHPLVFAVLDALAVGESFILINDHDPVPLSRQIEDRRPGQVTWEYERREPGMFRIRITRIAAPDPVAISA